MASVVLISTSAGEFGFHPRLGVEPEMGLTASMTERSVEIAIKLRRSECNSATGVDNLFGKNALIAGLKSSYTTVLQWMRHKLKSVFRGKVVEVSKLLDRCNKTSPRRSI